MGTYRFCSVISAVWFALAAAPALAEVILDGTLAGPDAALNGPEYAIGAELGQQRGTNLFHSFRDFSLEAGEEAVFSGPENVRNVMSRVTGGRASHINGTIRSTMPQADMYFLNPAGVMFGPEAKLDVQGSFHASTADTLRLADGGEFNALQPEMSTLSIAPPVSFGFLSNAPAPVEVAGSELVVPERETLSLAGGGVQISDAIVTNDFGRIDLASVSGAGEVVPEKTDLAVSAPLGNIVMDGASIGTNGEGGGAIYIRAGQVISKHRTGVVADTLGGEDAIGIDVQADSLIIQDGGVLSSNTFGSGNGGQINIKVGELRLENGSVIGAISKETGKGGDINIQVNGLLELSGETEVEYEYGTHVRSSLITTAAESHAEHAGSGGDIEIAAGKTRLLNGARILANTFGPGHGGNIRIKASEDIVVSGENTEGVVSAVSSESSVFQEHIQEYIIEEGVFMLGHAGNIVIEAEQLNLENGSAISSSSDGTGDSGDIILHLTDSVNVYGVNSYGFSSGITSVTGAAGKGGDIVLKTGELILEHSAYIDASTIGTRVGGTISIDANTVDLRSNSVIAATTESSGDGGNIIVDTRTLRLKDGSMVVASSYGEGLGGNIKIQATDLVSLSGEKKVALGVRGSLIAATAENEERGAGNGGEIDLVAGALHLLDGGQVVATTFGPGKGGNIQIEVFGEIIVSGEDSEGSASAIASGAKIFPGSDGELVRDIELGGSGDIVLHAGSLELKDGGVIVADVDGAGDGGNIRIMVRGPIKISGVDSSNKGSQINVSTTGTVEGAGDSGFINIEADSLYVADGGQISSATYSTGKGGDTRIKVDGDIILSGYSTDGEIIWASGIYTGSFFRGGFFSSEEDAVDILGDSGNVFLESESLLLDNIAVISAETDGRARGGNITVQVKNLNMRNGALITSSASGEGNGGNINISVDNSASILMDSKEFADIPDTIRRNEMSGIAADSSGSGNAGNVILDIGNSLILQRGAIETLTEQSDGGDISIVASSLKLSDGSHISSEVFGDIGNGGNIDLQIDKRVMFSNSFVTASVQGGEGNGGNIRFHPEYPQFVILNNSDVVARTYGGTGGHIYIKGDHFIRSSDTVVSAEATSRLGIDGEVQVDAPEEDVGQKIHIKFIPPLEKSGLAKRDCAHFAKGDTFISRGRAKVPERKLLDTAWSGFYEEPEAVSVPSEQDLSQLGKSRHVALQRGCK